MERVNLHLAKALESRYSVTVSGPAGCGKVLSPSVLVYESRHRPLGLFLLGAAIGALRTARRARPKIVIAGSGLTAPLAWLAARFSGARTVVYLHGLDIVAPSYIYSRLWLPFIRRMQLVLVNSRNTARLAERERISPARVHILHPGTELPAHETDAGVAFRRQHGLGERPLLLSVGRLTPRKGLAELVARALPKILEAFPEALLLIVGDDARDAVKRARSSELERIRQSAMAAGVERAIRFLPPCDDATLSAAYRAADVHVFPVREMPGDVEGFGMVAIEAAAHGLPTVAFDCGGVADALVEGVTGDLVPSGDYDAFAAAINTRLSSRADSCIRPKCAEAARKFGWDRFESEFLALLDESMASKL